MTTLSTINNQQLIIGLQLDRGNTLFVFVSFVHACLEWLEDDEMLIRLI